MNESDNELKIYFNSIKRNNPGFVAKNDKHLLSTAVVVNGRHVITCMKKKSKKFNWN